MSDVITFTVIERHGRWSVHKGDAYHGSYLHQELAIADATEAAQDERHRGNEARVYVRLHDNELLVL